MKQFFLFLLLFNLTLHCNCQPGIKSSAIDIVRDSFGVPHIFAKTDEEVAYGLAWAEAEDDFTSMQEVLLPAKGLMGKVKGKKGAAGDYVFELFRCRQVTEEKWATLSPGFLKLIDGYVQAINRYALKNPKDVLHKQLFPITAKEYVSTSVLALTIFNGADAVVQRILIMPSGQPPNLIKRE